MEVVRDSLSSFNKCHDRGGGGSGDWKYEFLSLAMGSIVGQTKICSFSWQSNWIIELETREAIGRHFTINLKNLPK